MADSQCFGCAQDNPQGLHLVVHHDGDGPVWAQFSPRPEHEGPPGHVHGGLAATALDEAMGWAAFESEDEAWVTASLQVRYRRPVPLAAGPYRIETEMVKHSGRRKRITGRLLLGDGSPAVEAEAVFVRVGSELT